MTLTGNSFTKLVESSNRVRLCVEAKLVCLQENSTINGMKYNGCKLTILQCSRWLAAAVSFAALQFGWRICRAVWRSEQLSVLAWVSPKPRFWSFVTFQHPDKQTSDRIRREICKWRLTSATDGYPNSWTLVRRLLSPGSSELLTERLLRMSRLLDFDRNSSTRQPAINRDRRRWFRMITLYYNLPAASCSFLVLRFWGMDVWNMVDEEDNARIAQERWWSWWMVGDVTRDG